MFDDNVHIAHRREQDGEIQTVGTHLLGVGRLASGFAGKLGLSSHGEVLGLLHDLGKYAKAFRDHINGGHKDGSKVDHSTAGAQFIWRELSASGGASAVVAQLLALCIASHHGGLIDCLTPEGKDRFRARMEKEDGAVHLEEALAKADKAILERCRHILRGPGCLESLIAFLKAIGNKEVAVSADGKETRIRLMGGLLIRMLLSCLVDADHTDSADFEQPENTRLRLMGCYPGWDVLIDRLEKRLAAFENVTPVDRVRKQVSEECLRASERPKGAFTLTVPTGGGKTLASLRFALHHARRHGQDRVIYVVPYTTIIDQNADETRRILEPADIRGGFASVVLEHHSNLTPEEETPRSKVLSENWDAPVIYTTMVQVLESLFDAGTRSLRRMHRLINAVIVFDEIQTLPVKVVHLFCNAVNFLVDHCGSSVVLCTATQPLLGQVDLTKGAIRLGSGSEIIADVSTLFSSLKRVDVVDHRKVGGWNEEEVVDFARRAVHLSGSCLVVVNTKKAARSLYQLCKVREQAAEVSHLSTNMCPAHRRKVLDRIESRLGKKGRPPKDPGPLLCVSTQLIEAGVDVDFGSVIRFVAGLDSIAQVAGRCNRHGRRDMGTVMIVNPAEENLRNLEDIRAGREATVRILGEFLDAPDSFGREILNPKAMERYFLYYFFERKHLMDYPVVIERDDTLLNLLSVNSSAVAEYKRRSGIAPGHYWRQSFMTAAKAFHALDAPTQGVIVPYGDEGQALVCDMCAASSTGELHDLLRKAQRYSVNVFPWVLTRLQEQRAVHEVQPGTGILYVDPRYYSEEFGLSTEPVSEQPFLNV